MVKLQSIMKLKLLIIATTIYHAFGFNLEFNSKQFPSWIKEPTIYSSYRTDSQGIAYVHKDSFSSGCIYFMPVHDEPINKTGPYIFEPKCYKKGKCDNGKGWIRTKNSVTLIDEFSCYQTNGTIDKVGIFSIAEFNYQSQEIEYTVYIVIEGCSSATASSKHFFEPITWILTNDTKFKPTILKHYLLNLPVNDNKFYFGEMTFDGDRDCKYICSEIICEEPLQLNIRRNGETGIVEEPTADDIPITIKAFAVYPKDIYRYDHDHGTQNGFVMYVAIVGGVIFVLGLLSYLVYHTFY